MRAINSCSAIALAFLALSPAAAQDTVPATMEGIWKQHYKDPDTGKWQPLGWYRLGNKDGKIYMEPVYFSMYHRDLTPVKSFKKVQIVKDEWTIEAEMIGKSTVEWKLKAVGESAYEGDLVSSEGFRNKNRWELIPTKNLPREAEVVLLGLDLQIKYSEEAIPRLKKDYNGWKAKIDAGDKSITATVAANNLFGKIRVEEVRLLSLQTKREKAKEFLGRLRE